MQKVMPTNMSKMIPKMFQTNVPTMGPKYANKWKAQGHLSINQKWAAACWYICSKHFWYQFWHICWHHFLLYFAIQFHACFDIFPNIIWLQSNPFRRFRASPIASSWSSSGRNSASASALGTISASPSSSPGTASCILATRRSRFVVCTYLSWAGLLCFALLCLPFLCGLIFAPEYFSLPQNSARVGGENIRYFPVDVRSQKIQFD